MEVVIVAVPSLPFVIRHSSFVRLKFSEFVTGIPVASGTPLVPLCFVTHDVTMVIHYPYT